MNEVNFSSIINVWNNLVKFVKLFFTAKFNEMQNDALYIIWISQAQMTEL